MGVKLTEAKYSHSSRKKLANRRVNDASPELMSTTVPDTAKLRGGTVYALI